MQTNSKGDVDEIWPPFPARHKGHFTFSHLCLVDGLVDGPANAPNSPLVIADRAYTVLRHGDQSPTIDDVARIVDVAFQVLDMQVDRVPQRDATGLLMMGALWFLELAERSKTYQDVNWPHLYGAYAMARIDDACSRALENGWGMQECQCVAEAALALANAKGLMATRSVVESVAEHARLERIDQARRAGLRSSERWRNSEKYAVKLARVHEPAEGWRSASEAASKVKSEVANFARMNGEGFVGDPQRQVEIWLRRNGIKRRKSGL